MRKQLWWLGFLIILPPFAAIYWLKIYERGERNDHDWTRAVMCDFYWTFFLSRSCKMVPLVVWRFCFLGVAILILGGQGNEGSSEISLLGCSLVVAASIVFACCLRWTKSGGNGFSPSLHIHFDCVSNHHYVAIYFITD